MEGVNNNYPAKIGFQLFHLKNFTILRPKGLGSQWQNLCYPSRSHLTGVQVAPGTPKPPRPTSMCRGKSWSSWVLWARPGVFDIYIYINNHILGLYVYIYIHISYIYIYVFYFVLFLPGGWVCFQSFYGIPIWDWAKATQQNSLAMTNNFGHNRSKGNTKDAYSEYFWMWLRRWCQIL
jgi:hypothetical protein